MDQATMRDRTGTIGGEPGASLSCQCWDCRAWRRHLLAVGAVTLLAVALAGEVGWRLGWWRAPPGAAAEPAAEVLPRWS